MKLTTEVLCQAVLDPTQTDGGTEFSPPPGCIEHGDSALGPGLVGAREVEAEVLDGRLRLRRPGSGLPGLGRSGPGDQRSQPTSGTPRAPGLETASADRHDAARRSRFAGGLRVLELADRVRSRRPPWSPGSPSAVRARSLASAAAEHRGELARRCRCVSWAIGVTEAAKLASTLRCVDALGGPDLNGHDGHEPRYQR